jgi:hypothetical protein
MPDEIPDSIRSFIAEHVGSLVQLELLLLLAADPAKGWSPEESAQALFVAPDATYGLFEAMRAQGLCVTLADDATRYSLAPASSERQALLKTLAELYRTRRLTITDLIFKGPVEKYQRFANAFRFRREK